MERSDRSASASDRSQFLPDPRDCHVRRPRQIHGLIAGVSDHDQRAFDAEIRPAGLEPATDGLENRCSIHLSYGRNQSAQLGVAAIARSQAIPHPVELRPAGFEPATCGLGNRRSIHLSYEREVFASVILRHETVCCQRVCDVHLRADTGV